MTFSEYIHLCFANNLSLIVWGRMLYPIGHRDDVDGITFIVDRLATPEESASVLAVADAVGFEMSDPEYCIPHVAHLDTLLGQLEHEHEIDEVIAVKESAPATVQEVADFQAAYDRSLSTDPTRW